jgi:hypothetical protein
MKKRERFDNWSSNFTTAVMQGRGRSEKERNERNIRKNNVSRVRGLILLYCMWAFEIPVTHDMEKARVNGLYVPSKEVK